MADVISGITSLFTCLKDCCFQSCNYIVSYEGAISSLAAELAQLKSKREDIKRQIEAAERDGLNPKREVIGWLESVEALASDAETINASYRRMFKCLCNFPVNVCSSYPLRSKAEAALMTAADLKEKAGEFADVADDLDADRVLEMPNPKTVGMDTPYGSLHDTVDGMRLWEEGEQMAYKRSTWSCRSTWSREMESRREDIFGLEQHSSSSRRASVP